MGFKSMQSHVNLNGSPFALIASPRLGLNCNVSLVKTRPFGLVGTQVAVNVLTGNMALLDEVTVAELGGGLQFSYAYNSLEKSWRFAASNRLVFTTDIVLTKPDGESISYSWDALKKAYVAVISDESRPLIIFNEATQRYEWYDPKSRVREYFNKDGDLLDRIDEKGQRTQFFYLAQGVLSKVIGASGSVYTIQRDTDSISIYKDQTILQRYWLNAEQQLTSSVNRDNVTTQYRYDNQKMLSDILQEDTSRLHLTYANGKIKSLGADTVNELTFIFSENQTKISALNGYNAQLEHSPNQLKWQELGLETQFNLTTHQQIEHIIFADKTEQSFSYHPAHGFVTQTLQRDGGRDEWVYTAEDEPVPALRLHFADATSTITMSGTRFIYSKTRPRQLLFTISLSGQVTEYRYNAQGLPEYEYLYLTHSIQLSEIAWQKTTEEQVKTWLASLSNPQRQIKKNIYDAYGNLVEIKNYPLGEDVKECLAEQRDHDLAGRVTSRIQSRNDVLQACAWQTFTAAGEELTNTLGADPALSQVTRIEYINQITKRTLPTGLQEITERDQDGQVVKISLCAGNLQRITEYKHYQNGNWIEINQYALRDTQVEDAQKSLQRLDAKHRPTYEISVGGFITQHRYLDAVRCKVTTQFAKSIDLTTLYSYSIGWYLGRTSAQPNDALLNKALIADSADRETLHFYTVDQKPQYEIDPEGYIVEYRYDTQGHELDCIRYAEKMTEAERADLMQGKPLCRTPNRLLDRIISNSYDQDGNLLAKQDEAGYITLFERDAGGRVTSKRHFLTPLLAYHVDLKTVLPDVDAKAAIYRYFYDNNGRCTLSIDPENYATIYEYEFLAKPVRETRVAKKVQWSNGMPDIQNTVADETTHYQYDELGRTLQITAANGLITEYAYDKLDHVTSEVRRDGRSDAINGDTYRAKKEIFNEFAERSEAADPFVLLAQKTATDPDAFWRQHANKTEHSATGLVKSMTDALGHRTLFFYDKDRRLVLSINPLGAVKQYQRDAFGQVENERAYALPIAPENLATLTGGLITPAVLTLLKSHVDDRIIAQTHDRCGNIISKQDAEGAISDFKYNAFGDCIEEKLPAPEPGAPAATLAYEYDPRGMRKKITRSATDIGVQIVEKSYNHYLGLETDHCDAVKGNQHFERDLLGNCSAIWQQTDDTVSYQAERTTFDAFNRPLLKQNADGEVKQFSYREQGRITEITTAQQVCTVWQSAFGEVIEKQFGLGMVEKTTHHPDGSVHTKHNALSLESQIKRNLLGEAKSEWHQETGKVSYKRNAAHALTQSIKTLSRTNKYITQIVPNTFGEAETVTDARGIVTQNRYNRRGQLVQKNSLPVNAREKTLTKIFKHSPAGSLLTVSEGNANEPALRTTKRQVNSLDQEIKSIINPGNLNITTSAKLDAAGNKICATDENGFTTRRFFNLENRLCLQLIPHTDNTVFGREYQYTPAGKVQTLRIHAALLPKDQFHDQDTLSPAQSKLQPRPDDTIIHYCYDEIGQEVAKIQCIYDPVTQQYHGIVQTKEWDAAGRLVAEQRLGDYLALPSSSLNDPKALLRLVIPLFNSSSARRLSYFYDTAGNKRFAIANDGTGFEYRYDNRGRRIMEIEYGIGLAIPPAENLRFDPKRDRITYFAHDELGRETHVVAANGLVTQKQYDSAGNITLTCDYKESIFTKLKGDNWVYDDLIAELIRLKPRLEVDKITQAEFDRQNQFMLTTDPLGFTDYFERDALGHLQKHTDRNGGQWHYTTNAAGFIEQTETPVVPVSAVSQTKEGKLQLQTAVLRTIIKHLELDSSGNAKTVLEDFGTDGVRKQQFKRDAAHRIIETECEVTVNDPNKTASVDFTDLPVKKTKVQTKIIYDTRGNEIARSDEENRWTYQVYDSANRLRFVIKNETAVTEYEYNAFNEKEVVRQYAQTPNLTWANHRENGLDLAELLPALIRSPLDRVGKLTYDAAGNITKTQAEKRFFYADGEFGIAQPETIKDYNCFGDVVHEQVLIRPGVYQHTWRWFNTQGKLLAEVNAGGYLTRHTYDLQGNEVSLVEYAKPLALLIDENTLLTDLDAHIEPSAKDRQFSFTHSLRNELLTETTKNVVTQVARLNEDNTPYIEDAPPQDLTKTHAYDGIGQRFSTKHPDGLEEQTIRDARGIILAEVDLPRANSSDENAPIQIPLKHHHVDAFGKRLATQIFNQAAEDNLTPLKNKLYSCLKNQASTTPAVLLTANNILFVQNFDERGQALIRQNSQGDLIATIRNETGKIVRHLELARVFKDPTQGTELTNAIDETNIHYHALGMPTYQGVARNGKILQETFTRYNVFKEATGISPDNLTWAQQQYTDNAGIWCTNASGVWTILLQDLRGLETLRLQGEKQNISQFSVQQLPAILSARAEFNCTESRHNALGQLVQFFLPHNFTMNPAKPARDIQPDRWDNPLQEINGEGAVTLYDYNHDNQELWRITPAVTVMDNAGVEFVGSAMVRKAYNLRSHLIGEVEQGANHTLSAHYEGLTKAYLLNTAGLTLAVIQADGVISERNTYDISSHCIMNKDEGNELWIFKVNLEGQVQGVSYPSGLGLVFLLDHHGERLVVRDKANREWRYGTDPFDAVTVKITPTGSKTLQTSDRNQLPLEITYPDQTQLKYERDFFGTEDQHTDRGRRTVYTERDGCKQPTHIYAQTVNPGLTTLRGINVLANLPNFSVINHGAVEEPTALQNQQLEYNKGMLQKIIDHGLQQIQTMKYDNEARRTRTLLSKMNGEMIKDISQIYNRLGDIETILNREMQDWGLAQLDARFINDIYRNRHFTSLLYTPAKISSQCTLSAWPPLREYHLTGKRHELLLLGGQLVNGEIKAVANHGLVMAYQNFLRSKESRLDANYQWTHVDLAWNKDRRFLSSLSNNGIFLSLHRNDSDWIDRIDFNYSNRLSYQQVLYKDANGIERSGFSEDGMPVYVSDYGNDKPGDEVKLQAVNSYQNVIPGTTLPRYISRLRQWPAKGHTDSELTQHWLDYHYFDTPELVSDHGQIFNGKPGPDNYARLLYDANQMPNAKINAADELLIADAPPDANFNQATVLLLNSPEKWFINKRTYLASQIYNSTFSGFYGFLQNADGEIYGGYSQLTSSMLQIEDAALHARGISHDGVSGYPFGRLQICNNYRCLGFFIPPAINPVNDCMSWDMPQLPPLGIKIYTIQPKETVLSIAMAEFGDPDAAALIARLNGLPSILHPLAWGRDLFLPDYVSPYNKANQPNPLAQFKSQLLSQLAPHLTAPVIKPHRPHTWYKVLIKAIALALIAAYAPELAPQFLMSLVGAHIATGIVAALGDVVVQGVCMATNLQKNFSINEVIETAVTFSAGAGSGPLNSLTDAAKMALNVAAMNAATQLFEMAIGTSKQFNFQSLALQVTSSLISAKLSMKGTEAEVQSASALKAAIKDGITQTFQAVLGSALTGQPLNIEETLAHSLGNSIGNNLSEQLKQHFESVATVQAAKQPKSAGNAGEAHSTTSQKQGAQRRAFFERSKVEKDALGSGADHNSLMDAQVKAKATRAKRWYDESMAHSNSYDQILAKLNPSDYTDTPAGWILKNATAAGLTHFTPLDYVGNRAGEIVEAHGWNRAKAIGSAAWDAATTLPEGVSGKVLAVTAAKFGVKSFGVAKAGLFALNSEIVKNVEALVPLSKKTVRFTELALKATKNEVRIYLKSNELNLPLEQRDKILDILGGGRMDSLTLKKMSNGDIRLITERSGHTNGFQRFSFEVNQAGQTEKIVQTAFDDSNKLVHQKPGEFKNNLYDVKKWKK